MYCNAVNKQVQLYSVITRYAALLNLFPVFSRLMLSQLCKVNFT